MAVRRPEREPCRAESRSMWSASAVCRDTMDEPIDILHEGGYVLMYLNKERDASASLN